VPAPHLNVLVAGWIQFVLQDWLSHGPNHPTIPPHRIPVPQDDDWPNREMIVLRSNPDRITSSADGSLPATYRNTETHW
jgi:hypothetical protein